MAELQADATAFAVAVLKEANSRLDLRPGVPLYEAVVLPLAAMLQPLIDLANDISDRQSFAEVDNLSEEDVDRLAANLFLTRIEGSKATGLARVFFDTPQSFSLQSGTTFLSSSGLRFVSTEEAGATEERMAVQQQGGLYYLDVTVEAEEAGVDYDIDAHQLVSVLSASQSLVQVDNPNAFSAGRDRETNAEFIARIAQAITLRATVTDEGIFTVLTESFPEIYDLEPIGFRDPEMTRDILTGTNISFEGDLVSGSVNVGGKFDTWTKVRSVATEQLVIPVMTTRNRFRALQRGDTAPIPSDTQYLARGGVIEDVTYSGGNTLIEEGTISLTDDELLGRFIRILDGTEKRKEFEVLGNDTAPASGNTRITVAGQLRLRPNESFLVVDDVSRPLFQITDVTRVDAGGAPLPALTGFAYITAVESPAFRFSDIEKVALYLVDKTFAATGASVVAEHTINLAISSGARTDPFAGGTIATATEAGLVATITTDASHGILSGSTIVVSGVPVGGYNGTWVVTGVPALNQLTYAVPGALVDSDDGAVVRVNDLNWLSGRTLRFVNNPSIVGTPEVADTELVGVELTVLTCTDFSIVARASANVFAGMSSIGVSQLALLASTTVIGGGLVNPSLGQRFRVTHETASIVQATSDFLVEGARRVVCVDPLSKVFAPIFIDVNVPVRIKSSVSTTQAALEEALQDFILDLRMGDALQASDLVGVIYQTLGSDMSGVHIVLPLTITYEQHDVSGLVTTGTFEDQLVADRLHGFFPRTVTVDLQVV